MMWPPPLLRQRGRAAQLVLLIVLPTLFGAACGLLLGTSGLVFQIAMALGAVGGVGAGFEHASWRGGFWRGASGGALFAAALLVGHTLHGVPARATLPAPLPWMTAFYAGMGIPFGALGGWLRGRRV
jgi:hypothetical protein